MATASETTVQVWKRGALVFEKSPDDIVMQYGAISGAISWQHEVHVDEKRGIVWLMQIDSDTTVVHVWDLKGACLWNGRENELIQEWTHADNLDVSSMYCLRELLIALLVSRHPLVSKGCYHPNVFLKVASFLE